MARTVRYHPLFECDVIEAANWYDDRAAGLGEAFIANARAAAESAIASPDRFGTTPLGLRYVRVKRFPYVVLFDLSEQELLMLGVLHTARSMDKWRRERT